MNKPVLYLIPAPLGNTEVSAVLPQDHIALVRTLKYFVVEELRTARRYLSAMELSPELIELNVLNEHTPYEAYHGLLDPLRRGYSMGMISEAGLPAVADPGAELVALAHKERYEVVPLVGPSSLMMALMASGLNGQSFVFHGYLPVKAALREKKLRALEKLSAKTQQTQIFIETPYRNHQLFQSLITCCSGETRLTLAINLTLPDAFIRTKTIEEWKLNRPDFEKAYKKKPCVFLILA
ncbi:MAG: SAM-dependent methyltransferase [Bacteroidales bacterium]|nr:SAM-dependent methyltransferase [Bacteroidales bacterium]